MNDVDSPTTATTLEQWRSAERAVAVARRGKTAAAAAVAAAMLAEKSAARTAAAAKIVVQSTQADFTDATGDLDAADLGEEEAHEHYRSAIEHAGGPSADR